MMMGDDIIEQLQTKIAYLERANIELSDAVFRQEREIRALEVRLEAIAERMRAGLIEESNAPVEDQRPPHY